MNKHVRAGDLGVVDGSLNISSANQTRGLHQQLAVARSSSVCEPKRRQSGFALALVLVLIAALALVSLFALDQARREQRLANYALHSQQVTQTCLSLGQKLIHLASQTDGADWPELAGDWCLGSSGKLRNACPASFGGISNHAWLAYNPGADATDASLEIASSTDRSCKESIVLKRDVHGRLKIRKRIFAN